MLYNMCHVILYDICSEQNMLYNMCHVMLNDMFRTEHIITCVMLSYMTYAQNRTDVI